MNIEDDFMWVTGNVFSEMRLMVKGAITLFEDDAGVLCRLAKDAQKNEAQIAFNDIGTALYAFRNHIRTLQAAHHKAAMQEAQKETHRLAVDQDSL